MEKIANFADQNYQISTRKIVDTLNEENGLLASVLDRTRSFFEKLQKTNQNSEILLDLTFHNEEFDKSESVNWKCINIVDCATAIIRHQQDEIQMLKLGLNAQIQSLLLSLN